MGDGFDNFLDGIGEIISNGADEAAQALFTGNGYTGAEWSPPEASAAAEVIEEPIQELVQEPIQEPSAPQAGWGEQVPMGYPEIGLSENVTINDMEPQVEAPSYSEFLEGYAPVAPPEAEHEIDLER